MSDSIDLIVGRRLRTRRRLLGITQVELARACGVTFQQIQKYESASRRLSAHMLFKLACALDVEIGYFFVGLARDEGVHETLTAIGPPAEARAA